MRPDMQHLLVEGGHAWKEWPTKQPKGWKKRCRFRNAEDRDEESHIAPRFRPQFSENLPPLRRFLERQVGRPWDKVYSEIRAYVNADSAVQYHILQHLYDNLIINTWADENGRPWCMSWSGPQPLDGPWRRPVLYVCPRTGLLRRTRQRTRSDKPKHIDHLPAGKSDHEYRSLGNNWYEVRWDTTTQDGKTIRYIAYKRQLGYKELRNLGLRD